MPLVFGFFVYLTNAFALRVLTMLTRRMIVVKGLGGKQSWPMFRTPGLRTEIRTRYLARTALIKTLHHDDPSFCLVQSRPLVVKQVNTFGLRNMEGDVN